MPFASPSFSKPKGPRDESPVWVIREKDNHEMTVPAYILEDILKKGFKLRPTKVEAVKEKIVEVVTEALTPEEPVKAKKAKTPKK